MLATFHLHLRSELGFTASPSKFSISPYSNMQITMPAFKDVSPQIWFSEAIMTFFAISGSCWVIYHLPKIWWNLELNNGFLLLMYPPSDAFKSVRLHFLCYFSLSPLHIERFRTISEVTVIFTSIYWAPHHTVLGFKCWSLLGEQGNPFSEGHGYRGMGSLI